MSLQKPLHTKRKCGFMYMSMQKQLKKFKDGSSYACNLHYERSTSKHKKNPCRGVKLAHQTRG